jgi:hypothetical protein
MSLGADESGLVVIASPEKWVCAINLLSLLWQRHYTPARPTVKPINFDPEHFSQPGEAHVTEDEAR